MTQSISLTLCLMIRIRTVHFGSLIAASCQPGFDVGRCTHVLTDRASRLFRIGALLSKTSSVMHSALSLLMNCLTTPIMPHVAASPLLLFFCSPKGSWLVGDVRGERHGVDERIYFSRHRKGSVQDHVVWPHNQLVQSALTLIAVRDRERSYLHRMPINCSCEEQKFRHNDSVHCCQTPGIFSDSSHCCNQHILSSPCMPDPFRSVPCVQSSMVSRTHTPPRILPFCRCSPLSFVVL